MLCCVAGMAVAEEKNILVTSGSDRATPIAVVPFGLQGGSVLPEDIADIIGNDLRNSGYYSPIPRPIDMMKSTVVISMSLPPPTSM